MILLPIAAREARETSRRARVYHARWIIAALGLIAVLFAFWISQDDPAKGNAVFVSLACVAHLYALFAGVIAAADTIAFERREQTLGLLFLTDLKPRDVLAGKFITSSATAFFGLLTILPLLCLPILLGGVTAERFLWLASELANTLLLSVSCGFVASSIFKQGWVAITAGVIFMALTGVGFPILCAFFEDQLEPLLFASPSTGLFVIWEDVITERTIFWQSIAFNHAFAWANFFFVAVRLVYLWRDRPPDRTQQLRLERWRGWRFGKSAARKRLRTQLLDANPLAWLANRERVSSWGLLTFCFVIFAVSLLSWMFDDSLNLAFASIVIAHLALFFRICVAAAYNIAEERRSGALELLLSTRLSVSEIIRGRWLALARQFFGPALLILLMHTVYLAHESMMESDSESIFQRLIAVRLDDSQTWFCMLALSMVILPLNWIVAGWLGMWLGLRSKTSAAAMWKTFSFVLVIPWAAYGLVLLALDMTGLSSIPDDDTYQTLLLLVAYVFGLGLAAVLMHRARRNLIKHFRLVTGDFSTASRFLLSWRKLARVGAASLALIFILACGAWILRAQINRRGEEAWRAALAGHPQFSPGETPLIALPPIRPEHNFAEAPLLRPLHDRDSYKIYNSGQKRADVHPIYRLHNPFASEYPAPRATSLELPPHSFLWAKGEMLSIEPYEKYARRRGIIAGSYGTPARAVLGAFTDVNPLLDELTSAASTRREARFPARHPAHMEIAEMLAIRAIAQLRIGEAPAADIVTIFRFAQGLQHLPEPDYNVLVPAFQPLYEGLVQRRWNDSQLIAFQEAIARIDLWSVQTNHLRKVLHQYLKASQQLIERPPADMPFQGVWNRLRPIGSLHESRAHILRVGLEVAPAIVDARAQRIHPNKVAALRAESALSDSTLHSASRFRQDFLNFTQQFAYVQTTLLQSQIACALERYRLAHGRFPKQIAELTPRYILSVPHDLFTGQPMTYRPSSDLENFSLSSVGWNGHDDGGVPAQFVLYGRSGDWVWNPTRRNTESATASQ